MQIIAQEFSGHKREMTFQKSSDTVNIFVIYCPLAWK